MKSVELEIDRRPDSNLKMKDMKKGQIAKTISCDDIVFRQESVKGQHMFIILSGGSLYCRGFDPYGPTCEIDVQLLEPGTVLNLKITV